MAGDEPQFRTFSAEQLGGALCAVLVIDAMESVAADALLEPFVRPGINGSGQRQTVMKSSVEDGDLRNLPQQRGDCTDSLDFDAVVQRRNLREAAKLSHHSCVDSRWFVEVTATMHDAMSDDVDLARILQCGRTSQPKLPQHQPQGRYLGICMEFLLECSTRGISHAQSDGPAPTPANIPFPQRRRRRRWSLVADLEEVTFLAA